MYTSWSVMGRFGLVSLGHAGLFGVASYVVASMLADFDMVLAATELKWRCQRR